MDLVKKSEILFHPNIGDDTRNQILEELLAIAFVESSYNKEQNQITIDQLKTLFYHDHVSGDFSDPDFYKKTHRITPFFPDARR